MYTLVSCQIVKLCTACIFTVNFLAPAAQRISLVKWLTPVKPRKNACPAEFLFLLLYWSTRTCRLRRMVLNNALYFANAVVQPTKTDDDTTSKVHRLQNTKAITISIFPHLGKCHAALFTGTVGLYRFYGTSRRSRHYDAL